MLAMASAENLSIAELQYKNERAYRSERDIEAGIDGLWVVMQAYVRWGLTQGDPMMSPGRACRLEIRPSLDTVQISTSRQSMAGTKSSNFGRDPARLFRITSRALGQEGERRGTLPSF